MLGETFGGKYEVLHLLGEGGMGVVYEARHTLTQRRVALKVLHGRGASHEPRRAGAGASPFDQREERFGREARVAARIDTPHIAQVLDAGTDAATGMQFVVFELLLGEDLEATLERVRVLPADTALRVASHVCRGLARAHEAHVVHRDIKPANLFLARQGDGGRIVKILDFGIAKIRADANAGNEAMTRTGWMLGSPLYMSPEQARGIKDIDHRTDVWSVGVVMYRMLCGRAPCAGIEAMGDLIMAICNAAPRHVRSLAPWVPADVADVVHKALRIDPAERFQSALEMEDALSALLPGGDAITDTLLVASPNAAQIAIPAPQSSTTIRGVECGDSSAPSSPPASRPLGDSLSTDAHAETVESGAAMSGATRTAPVESDRAALSPEVSVSKPTRRRTPFLAVAVLACGVGAGAMAMLRGSPSGTGGVSATAPLDAKAAGSAELVATVTPAVSPSPQGSSQGSSAASPPAATAADVRSPAPETKSTSPDPRGTLPPSRPTGNASARAPLPSAPVATAAPTAPAAKPKVDPLLPDRLE